MENPTPNPIESPLTPERGVNIRVVIDLLRHPEKEYATGKLTEAGKAALAEKLNQEYAEGDFDTVKCYVSPLNRGQESMEPIGDFLRENAIETVTRTKKELMGRATEIGAGIKPALTDLVKKENESFIVTEDNNPNRPDYEPHSQEFETAANEILVRDFFDQKFPDSPIGGKEIGGEVDSFIKHLAELAEKMNSGSKVKFVLISHSGVIEHFIKLVYLKNHPELEPKDVKVADIGGLMDYMSGPQISINSDESGKQKATIQFKDMVLDYDLN